MEEWRNIPGVEKYQASSSGKIRNRTTLQTLKPYNNKWGYQQVSVNNKNTSVHRLIAKAFLGESTLDVNHKDGVKQNNRIDNLEYLTKKENNQHSWDIGLREKCRYDKFSKIDLDEATQIRSLNELGVPQVLLAKLFGISQQNANDIIQERHWVR